MQVSMIPSGTRGPHVAQTSLTMNNTRQFRTLSFNSYSPHVDNTESLEMYPRYAIPLMESVSCKCLAINDVSCFSNCNDSL